MQEVTFILEWNADVPLWIHKANYHKECTLVMCTFCAFFKLSLHSEIWGSHSGVVENTTPCSWVSGSRRLEGTSCLHLQRGRLDRDDLNSYPYIAVSKYTSCKIWGSHSGPDKDWILLEYFVVLIGKTVLLFASWHAENPENVKYYSRKYHER
jgi:hypothetical protein